MNRLKMKQLVQPAMRAPSHDYKSFDGPVRAISGLQVTRQPSGQSRVGFGDYVTQPSQRALIDIENPNEDVQLTAEEICEIRN